MSYIIKTDINSVKIDNKTELTTYIKKIYVLSSALAVIYHYIKKMSIKDMYDNFGVSYPYWAYNLNNGQENIINLKNDVKYKARYKYNKYDHNDLLRLTGWVTPTIYITSIQHDRTVDIYKFMINIDLNNSTIKKSQFTCPIININHMRLGDINEFIAMKYISYVISGAITNLIKSKGHMIDMISCIKTVPKLEGEYHGSVHRTTIRL